MTLDSNVKALLTISVVWEQYTGQDDYGDPSFAASKTKLCWLEPSARNLSTMLVIRRNDETVYDPHVNMYFDMDDADVQAMDLRDRFTLPATSERPAAVSSRPAHMDVLYNEVGTAWLKVVSL